MNTTINAQNAPAALGPYSHAVKSAASLYISGQLGLEPSSKELAKGVQAQTTQALINMGEVLACADMGYADVVKTTVFLTDMADFAKVNDIYGQYFTENYPARSCIQVAALPKGAAVEIEAIAVK